jgi:hypothetical protein
MSEQAKRRCPRSLWRLTRGGLLALAGALVPVSTAGAAGLQTVAQFSVPTPQYSPTGPVVGASGPTLAAVSSSGDVLVFSESSAGWVSGPPAAQLVDPALSGTAATVGALAVSPSTIVAEYGLDDDEVYAEPAGGWSGEITPAASLSDSSAATLPGAVQMGRASVSGGAIAIEATPATTAPLGGPQNLPWIDVFAEPSDGWTGDLTETARLQDSDGRVLDLLGQQGSVVIADASNEQGSRVDVFAEPAGGWSGTVYQSATLQTDAAPTGSAPATASVIDDGAQLFAEPPQGWQGAIKPVADLQPLAGVDDQATLVDGTALITGCGASTPDQDCQDKGYLFEPPGGVWSGVVAARPAFTSSLIGLDVGVPAEPLLADGHTLMLTSLSGEITVLDFAGARYGHPFRPPPPAITETSLTGMKTGHPALGLRVQTNGTEPVSGSLALRLPAGMRFTTQSTADVFSSNDSAVTVRNGELHISYGPRRRTLITAAPGAITESPVLVKRLRHAGAAHPAAGTLQAQVHTLAGTAIRRIPLRIRPVAAGK